MKILETCEINSIKPEFYYKLVKLINEVKHAIAFCNPIGYFNDVLESKERKLFEYQFGELEIKCKNVIENI